MNPKARATSAALLLAGALSLGGNAMAGSEDLAFAEELESCIAAVTGNLDLSRADRVRHVVTEKDRTGIGYVLTIETSVFSGPAEQSYESYCVARGDREPVKFRIAAVTT